MHATGGFFPMWPTPMFPPFFLFPLLILVLLPFLGWLPLLIFGIILMSKGRRETGGLLLGIAAVWLFGLIALGAWGVSKAGPWFRRQIQQETTHGPQRIAAPVPESQLLTTLL